MFIPEMERLEAGNLGLKVCGKSVEGVERGIP